MLEERDNKHADVLKEAVLRAGKILRKAHARDNQPVHLKRFVLCLFLIRKILNNFNAVILNFDIIIVLNLFTKFTILYNRVSLTSQHEV